MAQTLSKIDIIQQYETAVRVPQGVNRFITIIGTISDVPIVGGTESAETYTCLVGPVLRKYEFLGATCLPSITNLDVSTIAFAECVIESAEAEWNEASGRTELLIRVSGAGAAAQAKILFSVTILAAA
jgi:hypothetical protein